MYTLDTNVIIYYLKGNKNVVSVLDDIFIKDTSIYISSITETELFSFSSLTYNDINNIKSILDTLYSIPVDSRLARYAGFLRSQCKIKTPDSIIASTAILTQTTLVTRNIKDFQKIPNISLLAV